MRSADSPSVLATTRPGPTSSATATTSAHHLPTAAISSPAPSGPASSQAHEWGSPPASLSCTGAARSRLKLASSFLCFSLSLLISAMDGKLFISSSAGRQTPNFLQWNEVLCERVRSTTPRRDAHGRSIPPRGHPTSWSQRRLSPENM
jgi:hypothetical protein